MSALIVVSEAIRKEFQGNGLIGVERISVIPDAVDLAHFRPLEADARVRREHSIPADAFLAVAAGRLSREKGHHVLVDASVEICRRLPLAHVLIAGQGDEHIRLTRQIERAGLCGRVVLAGFQHDIERVYAAADAFVLPSLKEGLGTVLLEAMAMERPIVASAVGGVPEVVDDGVTGRLVAAGDPAALAAAIIELASSPELASRLGLAGRAFVEGRFSLEAIVARIVRLYGTVLERRVAPPDALPEAL